MRRLLAVLGVGLLLLGGGCGGGDDEAKTDDAQAAAASDSKSSDDSGDDEDATTTTEEDSESDGDSSASGSGAMAAFTANDCIQAVQAISAAYSSVGLAMAGQTDDLEKTQKEFDALAKKAPDELRDDLDTLRDAYAEFGRVLQESGWKPDGKMPPKEVVDALEEASNKLDSDEVKAANDHVSSWFDDQCDQS